MSCTSSSTVRTGLGVDWENELTLLRAMTRPSILRCPPPERGGDYNPPSNALCFVVVAERGRRLLYSSPPAVEAVDVPTPAAVSSACPSWHLENSRLERSRCIGESSDHVHSNHSRNPWDKVTRGTSQFGWGWAGEGRKCSGQGAPAGPSVRHWVTPLLEIGSRQPLRRSEGTGVSCAFKLKLRRAEVGATCALLRHSGTDTVDLPR